MESEDSEGADKDQQVLQVTPVASPPDDASIRQIHDELWEGIIGQNEDKVKECVNKGARASYDQAKDGSTLLHVAAKIGNTKILDILLPTTSDIDAGNHGVGTALHFAVNAHGENLDACKLLLKHKAQLDAVDNRGRTALHDACRSDKAEIAKLLLDKGASVSVIDEKKRTALHEACNTGSESLCQLLISKGASVFAVDQRGRSSLHLASASGYKVIAEILMNTGAYPECQDLDGRTPLHYASRTNQKEVCELLLEKGAALETKDKRGRTALYFAVSTQSADVFSLLRSKGANINQPAALKMCRARRKHLILKEEKEEDVVESEMSKRVEMLDVCTLPHDGRSLLHVVAACGVAKRNMRIARALSTSMDYRGKIVKDLKGRTAYHIAAGRASTKLLDEIGPTSQDNDKILNNGTPLHSAAINGHLKNCRRLLKVNPDLITNAVDKDRNTALHLATSRGHSKVCELLIARKNIDVHLKNKNGETALHLAAARGDRDICKRLVQKGKNANDLDKKQRTPLHVSAYYNNRAASQSLISAWAKVNVKDKSDNTPLHSAARNHGEFGDSMCSILIKKKAKVLERNKVGDSPLDVWPEQTKATAVSLTAEVRKQAKAELDKTGTKQVEVVKLFLLGDPQAGKTTLKKSLSEKINGNKQDPESPRSSNSDTYPSDDYIPTAGIDIDRQAIGDKGDFCVWDCAGHIEFHVTHNMFLGAENAIFTVAYDLSDDRRHHLKKLQYWLSFIKAGHDYSDSSSPIPVVQIVATHIDLLPNKQEGRACAESTLQHVIKLYASRLDIRENLIVVDSRKAALPDMILLREKLHSIASDIKGSRKVPMICDEVVKRKDSWCQDREYPVMNWKEFVLGLKDIKLLHEVVEYLHNIGEIYRSKKIHGRHKVVLQPSWLCSTVIGPTFAGRDFPANMERLKDKQFFTLSDLKEIFSSSIDSSLLVGFLQDLNLAFRLDANKFIIPARLPVSEKVACGGDAMGDVSWHPDPNCEYHGVSFKCVDETDMFTADVFPSLQVQIMKYQKMRKKPEPLVANCKIKFVDEVECLVELDEPNQAIFIAVRSKKANDVNGRLNSFKALKNVEELTQSVLKERSPGTNVVKRFLSPSDIALKTSLKDVIYYSEDDIKNAYESDGDIVRSRSVYDKLTDVLFCGYDTIFFKRYGWQCDLVWLPIKIPNQSMKKDIEVGAVVYKHLDKKSPRVEDYRALAEILEGLQHDGELVLEDVMKRCAILKSSITAALVQEHWPKGSQIPRTVAGLYRLLRDDGLVGNKEAADTLKQAVNKCFHYFGTELPELQQLSSSAQHISAYIPMELQHGRAALRAYWRQTKSLHKDLNPKQIIDAIISDSILTQEDIEEVEGHRSEVKGSKLLLEKLILSRKTDTYSRFVRALRNPNYGVTHLAEGLERKYEQLLRDKSHLTVSGLTAILTKLAI